MIYVDYRAPVGVIRDKLAEIVKNSKNWDGRVVNLQVTDAKEDTIELRCLMSARSAGQAFDLRCEVREQLIDFLQKHHPEALPRQRSEVIVSDDAGGEHRAKALKRGAKPPRRRGPGLAQAMLQCMLRFPDRDGYPA